MPTDFLSTCLQCPQLGTWIETPDPLEAELLIRRVGQAQGLKVLEWNAAEGLTTDAWQSRCQGQPRQLLEMLPSFVSLFCHTVLVLRHIHAYLGEACIRAALRRAVEYGAAHRLTVVVLAPDLAVPDELQHAFNVVSHSLPTTNELLGLHRAAESSVDCELIAHGLGGLTRSEARYALSITGSMNSAERLAGIWSYKAWHVERHSLIRFLRQTVALESLVGMSHLKHQALMGTQPGRSPARRGLLILGPPGSGKKSFCQALGNTAGLPVVTLRWEGFLGLAAQDLGSALRTALATVEALSRVVMVCDTSCRGLTEMGFWNAPLAARLWAILLEWLQRPKQGVYFVATGESPGQVPKELWQREFLDAAYFLDLPDASQCEQVWQLGRKEFGLPEMMPLPTFRGWTPSEVHHCCRTASLMGLTVGASAKLTTPYSELNAENLMRLRHAAAGRSLTADNGELYRGGELEMPRRWIDPSIN